MALRAGRHSRRVQFERDVLDFEDRDAIEPKKTAKKTITRWADQRSIYAKDRIGSGGAQNLAIRAVKIVILWSDDVKPQDRFWMEGKLYEVTGIAEIGFHEALEIMGEEVIRGQDGDD